MTLLRHLRAWGRELVRFGAREPVILLAVLLLAGAAWVFAVIADEVIEGEAHEVDRAVLLALRSPNRPAEPLGPDWFEETMRDFTALGSVAVLGGLVLATAGYLLLAGRRRTALLVLFATFSGMAMTLLLKAGFDRPRPELVPHGAVVYTASFPSGHSMMAALVYLTLGALLARVQPNRRLKVYLLGLALLVTVLVGVSRVYLGVHWPSDVVAGWAAGAAWALAFWVVAALLEHRRSA